MHYTFTATILNEEVQLAQYLFGGHSRMQTDQIYSLNHYMLSDLRERSSEYGVLVRIAFLFV